MWMPANCTLLNLPKRDVCLLLRHDEQRGQEQERDDQRNDKERYKERHGITPFFGFSLKVLSHDLS